MKIEQLRQKQHLSASAIQDYMDCGLLYKFSRIDRLKPEHVADALAFGKAIHKVMADRNLALQAGESLEPDDLIERFNQYWAKEAQNNGSIKYGKGKGYGSYLDEGIGLIRAFHEAVPDEDVKVVSVEEPFEFTLDGLDIPIIGIMDLVETDGAGTNIIVDYKTASKAYSKSQIDNHFQMTLYQMAAIANGMDPDRILLRLDCLIKTKKPKFEQYYTTRTPMALARTRKKILTVWDGIQKGVFIPNETGWKCKTCAYKRYCNEWFDEEMTDEDLHEDPIVDALCGFG